MKKKSLMSKKRNGEKGGVGNGMKQTRLYGTHFFHLFINSTQVLKQPVTARLPMDDKYEGVVSAGGRF